MQPRVFIVLVNYNGKKYLDGCIQSIKQQTIGACPIILVDNGSSDGSLDIIKGCEGVHLIENKNNSGFAGGCNIGIKVALKKKADYVLLLNTDTVAEPDLIEKLLYYANENTVSTAKIYSDKYKKKIWYAAGCMDFDKGCSYNISPHKNKYITFISGCCMLVHRKIWETVGLMDENYFMYYEDDDFCMRLIQNGIHMQYTSETGLWHKVGGSGGAVVGSGFKAYYMTRNRLCLISKYKEYFFVSTIQVIWEILKENVFCSVQNDGRYKKYVLLGLWDFVVGNIGYRSLDDRGYVKTLDKV